MRVSLIPLLMCTPIALAAIAWAADNPKVDYPTGFQNWRLVKTGVKLEGHPDFGLIGGFRVMYANPQAVQGYKAGKFPDGSFIVMDILDAVAGDKELEEGKRKQVIVMEKDSKRFSATSGWGFEVFNGDSKTELAVTSMPRQECFACHTARQEKDYVFSTLRD